MKQKIAKAWMRALRSGKYKQTTGELRFVDTEGKTLGFCCLGVLCNLHAKAHPEFAKTQTSPHVYDGADAFLPKRVMQWAGIKTPAGNFSRLKSDKYDPGEPTDMSFLNDEDKLDFNQIADEIKANWRRL